jgi:hypothetical protein
MSNQLESQGVGKIRTLVFLGFLSLSLLPSSTFAVILVCRFPRQEYAGHTFGEKAWTVDTIKEDFSISDTEYTSIGKAFVIYRHSGHATFSTNGVTLSGTCDVVTKKKF